MKTIWIPVKDYLYISKAILANKFLYWLKKYLALPIVFRQEVPNFPAFTLKHNKNKIQIYTVLQFIKIKAYSETKTEELCILGIPGELLYSLGSFLKKRSPVKIEDSFIFQNSNDWIGYLFPKSEYIQFGGMESLENLSPICGEMILIEYLKFLKEIENETTFSHS